MSRQAGLFTWDKPAYACLATRVPAGETITAEKLEKTEKAEVFLRSLGLRDFRVRLLKGCARIQVPEGQLELVLKNRKKILEQLKQWYTGVVLEPVLPRPAVAADAQLRTQLDLPPQGISVIEQDEVRHALLLIGEIPSGSFAINNNAYCGSCVRPRTSCGA